MEVALCWLKGCEIGKLLGLVWGEKG